MQHDSMLLYEKLQISIRVFGCKKPFSFCHGEVATGLMRTIRLVLNGISLCSAQKNEIWIHFMKIR
jgi:hypothetical protein